MRKWGTLIWAKCPLDGEIKVYVGPTIDAPSQQLAFEYCQLNGLGYCHVSDELIMEIPCKVGTYEPDFNSAIDYDKSQNN